MKNKPIFIRALSVIAILLISLVSCVERPDEIQSDWKWEDGFEIDNSYDTALQLRFREYEENSNLAFSQNSDADGSAFDVEVTEGGVRIVKYTGRENIVVIPEKIDGMSVVAIGSESFAGSSVRAVKIPDSVLKIEKGAFSNCNNLSTIRVPFVGDGGEQTHFGYIFGAEKYENHAVIVPPSLDMVIVGDGESEIADNAFSGCKTVSAVVFSKNLEKIGEFAFYECRDLVYISSVNEVRTVGKYAFAYCSSLFSVNFNNADSIDLGAFYECNSIFEIGLAFIGNGGENNHLGYIFGAESSDYNDEYVPVSLKRVVLGANCKKIPDRAFANCAYVAEVDIPYTESVGIRAFYGCRSLENVDLPMVKEICDDAFFGCDNLQSANLGNGVEKIGMQAFFGCRSLKEIVIPEKVTEILPSTFAYCTALENVEMKNVKEIGKDAFLGCALLTNGTQNGDDLEK
jgi:hypothetical protein